MTLTRRSVLLAFLLVGVSLGSFAEEPAVLLVGPSGGFARIQDAIDAANTGDTIHVAGGEYTENLFVEKPIQLLGLGAVSLIPEDPTFPAITVEQEGIASIQHISIEGAAVGISILGECMVAHCDIDATEIGLEAIVWDPSFVSVLRCAFGGSGVGIQLLGSGDAYVLESDFAELGAAVLVGGGVTASISRCMIGDCFEGVIVNRNAMVVLLQSEIRDCLGTAVRISESPYSEPAGELHMIDNVVENNGKWAVSFGDVEGVCCSEATIPVLGEGNLIRNNGFGLICPIGVELPGGFLSGPGG